MCCACRPDESERDKEINCQEKPVNLERQRASMHAFRCWSCMCREAKISGEKCLKEGGERESKDGTK